MSDVAIAPTDDRGHGAAPPSPPQDYKLWRRVRRFGYVLLGLQLGGYLVWSVILYEHFSLTGDFAIYNQAWYLIAHGNFDPYSTIFGLRYWQNDGEFIFYVLAPLYWIFHTGIVMQWAQDLSLGGAELVAFTWLCDLARRHCAERDAPWLAGFGLLLLIANPWLWATISFDVHVEPLISFFGAFLAWDLSRGKRRAWAWVVPVMLGGAATTTYVMGIGLGGVLAGRGTRRMGAMIAASGIAYSLFAALVHGNGAAAGAIHAYVAETSGNPFRMVGLLWGERTDIIANLAPGGLVGIGAPLILPLALAVIVPDTFFGTLFEEPFFQNVPLYVFLPLGTVAVVAWLLRRHQRIAFVLAGVAAAQAIGWAVVWGPQLPVQWLRISDSEAATLASVQARIPASAEVVASQGLIGRFSQRTYAYRLFSAGAQIPIQPETWFVIAPTSGIETFTPATSMALIGELAGPLHAKLVTHANGIWAFRLTPPPGLTSVQIPGDSSPLPAWAGAGAASQPILDGAAANWHMAATGAKGYVADGMEWMVNPGSYRAEVTLSASAAVSRASVNVEVWDDNTSTLLARRTVLQTDGIQQIVLPVVAPAGPNTTVYGGWGPFRANFVSPPPGQRIEVRVWSPGGAAVNVYSAELTTASGSAIQPLAAALRSGLSLVVRVITGHPGYRWLSLLSLGRGQLRPRDEKLARADRLGDRQLVAAGRVRAGDGYRGGQHGGDRPGPLGAQRDHQRRVIGLEVAAPQRAGRRGVDRRRQVRPPGPSFLGRAADEPEVLGERRRLELERRAALPPRAGRCPGEAERAKRSRVVCQVKPLRLEPRGRGDGRRRPVSRCRGRGVRRGRTDQVGVDQVPGVGEVQGVERIARVEDQAGSPGVVHRRPRGDDGMRGDLVGVGPAGRDVADLVARLELPDAGEPGHVVRGQHARARLAGPGARRVMSDRVAKHRVAGALQDGSHQANGRRLEQPVGPLPA